MVSNFSKINLREWKSPFDQFPKKKKSTFQSPPGFPNTPSPCEMSVETKPTTCQVRVDLVDLALAPPVRASGRCRQSSHLAVSVPEGGRKVFGRGFSAFCGTNTGQHFYMDVTVPKQVWE